MEGESISEPLLVVTDRELALMNTLDTQFPNSNHLLCTWHVNMNVLANCRKHYLADTKDSTKATSANPHRYIPDPEWSNFLKDWVHLLDSTTDAEYTKRLVQFHTYAKAAVAYVEDT